LQKNHRLGVVPHFLDYEEACEIFSNRRDVIVVDVRQEVEGFVELLLSCQSLISSSLHGLILGHAYGVPSARCSFSSRIVGDDIKFIDYFAGMSIHDPPDPIQITSSTKVEDLEHCIFESPQAETHKAQDVLLDACPFRPVRN
jgi:hypothetical protein